MYGFWKLGRCSHHEFGGGRSRFLRRLGGLRTARMLASGDLQLLVLALLVEKPRHGYDVIKAFEEHSSGLYTPSPGVVYPALTYLAEAGYAVSEATGNKNLYSITDTGRGHLAKNRDVVDETFEHLARFGRKMARVRRRFADEEDEDEFDRADSGGRPEWRRLKVEYRELKNEVKNTLWGKIDASAEEQRRVVEILQRALAEIRRKG
jgi:DNA-binding PadR family transcriptional regulator